MNQRTLIIGATGKTGLPVVEEAIAAGLDVRAAIRREDDRSARLRDLGAETVIADVHNIASVRSLMEGVSRVYLSYPTHLSHLVEVTTNVAVAAKDEGVQAIVNMSQISVRENAPSALTHQHWLSEKILDWANVGAIHIRPNYFMENLLLFNAQPISQEGKIYLPYGNARHAPIAAKDIARVVARLLRKPEGQYGQRLLLTGPQNLTISQMAEIIGEVIGHRVDYVDLPAEQWKEILATQVGLPEFLTSHLYHVAVDHQNRIFDKQTDTVEALTGKPPQDLASFVREHEAQFIGETTIPLGV